MEVSIAEFNANFNGLDPIQTRGEIQKLLDARRLEDCYPDPGPEPRQQSGSESGSRYYSEYHKAIRGCKEKPVPGTLSKCHTVEDNNIKRLVKVFPGLSEFAVSPKLSQVEVIGAGGKRGKITKRSFKSRVRQLKHFAKLPSLPEMFSTFTVADDVMVGKNQREKVSVMNRCKREFNKYLWDCLGEKLFEFTWTQEMKKRKSGELKDEVVQHLHILWQVAGLDEAGYHALTQKLNLAWVKITGTEQQDKALNILLRDKSHQYLGDSRSKIMGYCAKYTVKQSSDAGEPGESIGRTWGSWGPIEESLPELMGVTENELSRIKRGLRKKFRKVKGWYLASLKVRELGTMAFISGSELIRWIETDRLLNTA